MGTRQRGDCDADATHRGRPFHVPSLLAGGRIGALSYLRGTSGVGALLVRRLLGALFLSEESTHFRDPNRHAIPLPVLAGERRSVFHEGSARVPKVNNCAVIKIMFQEFN